MAFTRGRSCLTNLLESLENWTKALDEGYGLDVVHLGYRKAFDSGEIEGIWNQWEITTLVGEFSHI